MGSAQSKGVDEGGTESVVQFGHWPAYSLVTQSPNSHLSEQKHILGILALQQLKVGLQLHLFKLRSLSILLVYFGLQGDSKV